MPYASIGPIAVHLPDRVETNAQLQAEFPKWDMDLIYSKTGIRERHIAEPDQCASDLGVLAAQRLFAEQGIDPRSIDFLLFCTQTPDYNLPTTACLIQNRLGLRTNVGALDFNLGCSGFVYGLGLADGLIRSGAARRVLLITAETYSKYIDREDRSLRTIFGDGAAATLIDAAEQPTLGPLRYGTDGAGADMLVAMGTGVRPPEHALQPRKRQRWNSSLFMDGPALVDFTVANIPPMVDELLASVGLARANVDFYLMHQATLLMMNHLRAALGTDEAHLPVVLDDVGNTVSSTIPIVIDRLRREGRLRAGQQTVLVGFGVGLSWAAALWKVT